MPARSMAWFAIAVSLLGGIFLQQSLVDQDDDGDADMADAILQYSDLNSDGVASTFESITFSVIVAILIAYAFYVADITIDSALKRIAE